MKQKNRITLLIMLLAVASVLMQSCGKDNMKYPTSTLKGRLTYQGQPVRLIPSNPDIIGSANTAALLLQQVSGRQERYGAGEVQLYVKNDGTFSSKFFDGNYQMRSAPNDPFESFINRPVTVSGDTDLGDIEVVPYWWMSDLATTYTGGVLTATFNLTRPSNQPNRNLERVYIFLSPTNLPDIQSSTQGVAKNWAAGTNAGGIVVPAANSAGGAVTVKVDLNTLTTGEQQFLRAMGNTGTIFASVGVKTNQINDALYSTPIKLQLP